ncbi:MAG: hypothetical protein U0232_27530 [Thermomicrobiales bacterium]
MATEARRGDRAAQAEEAGLLDLLALRAKAHWGRRGVFGGVSRRAGGDADGCGRAHGLWRCAMVVAGSISCVLWEMAKLNDLWVESGAIGRGHGRALWEHAVATTGERGCRELIVQATCTRRGLPRDGAVRVGTPGIDGDSGVGVADAAGLSPTK